MLFIQISAVTQLLSDSGLQVRVCNKNLFPYFSTKTYVVGAKKNPLNETVSLRWFF